eukprot:754631-Hanusia_phi.AAC.2
MFSISSSSPLSSLSGSSCPLSLPLYLRLKLRHPQQLPHVLRVLDLSEAARLQAAHPGPLVLPDLVRELVLQRVEVRRFHLPPPSHFPSPSSPLPDLMAFFERFRVRHLGRHKLFRPVHVSAPTSGLLLLLLLLLLHRSCVPAPQPPPLLAVLTLGRRVPHREEEGLSA